MGSWRKELEREKTTAASVREINLREMREEAERKMKEREQNMKERERAMYERENWRPG